MKPKLILSTLFCLLISQSVLAAEKPANQKKQTTLNLYLNAKEANDKVSKNKSNVLFIDVRTMAEVNFLGMPTIADANIPYVTFSADLGEAYPWNSKKNSFKLKPNNDFTTAILDQLKAKKLDKTADIILICRSGSRSSKAANLLAQAGFKKVYTVIDGYEGDKAKKGPNKGKRVVNGWKNSGLPWTYKLTKNKMYKVASQQSD